jgi:HD-like signal output (HDOD) protein
LNTKDLEKMISTSLNLPPMPHVAAKTIQLLKDPSTNAKDLQKIITSDSVLAANILKISNSALYGRSREITTISQAIVVLGFTTLRNIIISATTSAIYKRKGQTFGLKEKILWEHSICCSIAALIIAKLIKYHNPEEALIGGLLHDIGTIVLDGSLGHEYNEILKEAFNSDNSLINLEIEHLGYGHHQVGYMVIKNWNFAETLQDAVCNHHHPYAESKDSKLTKIIHLANNICYKLGHAWYKQILDFDFVNNPISLEFNFSENQINDILAQTEKSFIEEKEKFF